MYGLVGGIAFNVAATVMGWAAIETDLAGIGFTYIGVFLGVSAYLGFGKLAEYGLNSPTEADE